MHEKRNEPNVLFSLCRCPFFRIPSNASNARIKQYWSHITPTAFLTTTACLQQLEAAGLLAIHTSEAPGICTVDLQYEPGGTQTEAHTSVLTVVVDAIPDLALPLPTQQNVSAAAITAAGSSPGIVISLMLKFQVSGHDSCDR